MIRIICSLYGCIPTMIWDFIYCSCVVWCVFPPIQWLLERLVTAVDCGVEHACHVLCPVQLVSSSCSALSWVKECALPMKCKLFSFAG